MDISSINGVSIGSTPNKIQTTVPVAKDSQAVNEVGANRQEGVIYHKNKEFNPGFQVYEVKYQGNNGFAPSFNQIVSDSKAALAMNFKISDDSTELKESYDQVLNSIASKSSDLATKDWGFSIESDGELKVFENQDELSDSEIAFLEEELNSSSLASLSEKFAEDLIGMLEKERGVAQYSQSIGKYDLNRENFSEIIDIKEYLEKGMNSLSNTDNNYQTTGMYQIASQLGSRAEEKYNTVERIQIR